MKSSSGSAENSGVAWDNRPDKVKVLQTDELMAKERTRNSSDRVSRALGLGNEEFIVVVVVVVVVIPGIGGICGVVVERRELWLRLSLGRGRRLKSLYRSSKSIEIDPCP